jgi:hypothetical protein
LITKNGKSVIDERHPVVRYDWIALPFIRVIPLRQGAISGNNYNVLGVWQNAKDRVQIRSCHP